MFLRSSAMRALAVSGAIAAAVMLAGCETDGNVSSKHLKPLSPEMVALIEQKNMAKDSPVLVRLFKQESELEVWKQGQDGRFALLKTYPICRWSGELGPKIREGDRQAPEGFYTITPAQMNPHSNYYLSFNLGYPNAFDRAHGRTGSHLMVHGDCSSRGCYSMTDEQIAEIYALARESFFGGQRSFQVQAYPFRMTPMNMAKHRNNPHMPFWKMLKEGNDHFELTRLEPKVDVCEKRYVFNASAEASASFNAGGKCPVLDVPDEIASEVAVKTKRDESEIATLISRGTPAAPTRTGTDGGMHQVFLAKLRPQEVRTGDGDARMIVAAPAPGTIPAHVDPPREPAPQVAEIEARPASGNVPMPRAAPNRSGSGRDRTQLASAQAGTSDAGGWFSGVKSSVSRLFGVSSEDAKPASPPPARQRVASPPPAQRPVAAAPSAQSAPAPVAKPDPPPISRPSQPAAVQPAQTAATSERTGSTKSALTAETPAAAPAGSGGLMAGAQPVMPTGSFENRWGAFR